MGMMSYAGVPYTTAKELYGVSESYYSELQSDAEKTLDMIIAIKEQPCTVILLTQQFIARCVTALLVICGVPVERIAEFFEEVFQYHISKGTIHNIQKRASRKARLIDLRVTLEFIKYVAMDEIFQQGRPVLTGVDLETQYVFIMEETPDRTGSTWESVLNEKKANGLNPTVCVSDSGSGLQKGIPAAYPGITMQLDVFHALRDVGVHVSRQERRGISLLAELCTLERKVNGKVHQKTIKRYEELSATIDNTLHRTDTLCILYGWLKELTDFSGYGYAKSLSLCTWILDEMSSLFPESKKFQKALSSFRNRLPDILRFLRRLQDNLKDAAAQKDIAVHDLMLLYNQRACSAYSEKNAAIEKRIFRRLGTRMLEARDILHHTIQITFRASSMIENVNGRLRCYMNRKRDLSGDFLDLLKLYFNTRKSRRPANKSWTGTSALDRMTGCDNPSFLDMLYDPPDYIIGK